MKKWLDVKSKSLYPAPTPKTRRISPLLEQETRLQELTDWEKKVLRNLLNQQNKFGQLSKAQWEMFQNKILKRKLK